MSKESYNIAYLVGSLRKDSWNRKVAASVMEMASPRLKGRFVEIGGLPLYNEDMETENPPGEWKRFREEIAGMDGVLFFTPEYNRTLPAAIKNALDVGSRPYGKSVWDLKPAAVASASISAIGGFGANHVLRQSLVFLNMPCLQQPEVYIGGTQNLFNGEGKLNEDTSKFLKGFIDKYEAWMDTLVK